ncbi:MAG: hypothetical protein GVY29_12880, partial [Spirochaetes bacterium]|nr:hypothetical protein [Spirochaetota bacterium]
MTRHLVGIDVGSVSVSMAVVSSSLAIEWSGYRFHQGRPGEVLEELGGELLRTHPELAQGAELAVTHETPDFVDADERIDAVVANVRSCRALHPEARSLLAVGGERFFLVRFAEDGSYQSIRSSSSCAAGTGSFLDQQARRLALGGADDAEPAEAAAELSRLALSSTGERPQIASRCSVFAKTDLIHAQQEGFSLAQICDGLCHGLARNLINTVTQDASVPQPVVFAGGVSRNRAVQEHVEAILQEPMIVDAYGHLYGAVGAAIEALSKAGTDDAERRDADRGRAVAPLLQRLRAQESTTRSYQYDPLGGTR